MIALPNNRLILNGHKINSLDDLFAYTSKRLKVNIYDINSLCEYLSNYNSLQIPIWHSKSFLSLESEDTISEIKDKLSQHVKLKLT